MEQLETDLMLVCSNIAPDATDDDALAAADLHALGERAAQRGLRIGYEALGLGPPCQHLRHAPGRSCEEADHPAVGLVLDSFHTLRIDDDIAPIAKIPSERIFFVQLADAPLMQLDPLSWSRHFRLFPGQGGISGDALHAQRDRAAAMRGRSRWRSSTTIPRRAAAPDRDRRHALAGAARGGAARRRGRKPAPLIAVRWRRRRRRSAAASSSSSSRSTTRRARASPRCSTRWGSRRAGQHRSKDVTLYRQGDVQPDHQLGEGLVRAPFVLTARPLGVRARVPRRRRAQRAAERALRYHAQIFRGRVGPNELVIPAIRGHEGSLIYLVDRFGADGSIYDVDFTPADAPRHGPAAASPASTTSPR